ncbi:MAG: hypothetical protein IH984_06285 [Planctomycetes bacterium]|nr:hypothetical protein [Planctomycetota bacterium]
MIRSKHHQQQRLGFSLVEVLLAIFILGLGIISIVSLFPAGIAQQRQSVDDIIGPIVAQNAIATIRTRVRPEDFGTFLDVNNLPDYDPDPLLATTRGDWGWRRPAFYTSDLVVTDWDDKGTINLFLDLTLGSNGTISELPWNTFIYGNTPPDIRIPQTERYYPMSSTISDDIRQPRPEYVWDCMFRRFQGKIMVAIFVYRASIVGGGSFAYSVSFNTFAPNIPLLPINRITSSSWNTYGIDPATNADDAHIAVTDPYNTANQAQSWQEPGQWLLDQNNNLHRVMARYRNDNNQMVVELVRPVLALPNLHVYSLDQSMVDPTSENVVSNIFYIPREVEINNVSVRLTPVYVTVKEL